MKINLRKPGIVAKAKTKAQKFRKMEYNNPTDKN